MMRLADDADVEAVEELIGMGHGAWDMVEPHKLLDCVRLHFASDAPPLPEIRKEDVAWLNLCRMKIPGAEPRVTRILAVFEAVSARNKEGR